MSEALPIIGVMVAAGLTVGLIAVGLGMSNAPDAAGIALIVEAEARLLEAKNAARAHATTRTGETGESDGL